MGLWYHLQSNNNIKKICKSKLWNPSRITQVSVTFDVIYTSPDDEAGNFEPTNLINSIQQNSLDDDQQMLLKDIEQNIANLEKSLCQGKTWISSLCIFFHYLSTSKMSNFLSLFFCDEAQKPNINEKEFFFSTFIFVPISNVIDKESSSTHISKKRHILKRVMSQSTGDKVLKSDPKVMMVSLFDCVIKYTKESFFWLIVRNLSCLIHVTHLSIVEQKLRLKAKFNSFNLIV